MDFIQQLLAVENEIMSTALGHSTEELLVSKTFSKMMLMLKDYHVI